MNEIANYIRSLLEVNELKIANSLLSNLLSNPVYQRQSLLSSNDVFSNVIVGRFHYLSQFILLIVHWSIGFYGGKYYDRCLKVFHSIRPKHPDFEAIKSGKKLEGDMEKWKSTHNSLCYSAIIGSYYQQGDLETAIQYYEECRRLGLFPSFPEGMMVAKCHELSEAYKTRMEEWKEKKPTVPGIPSADL